MLFHTKVFIYLYKLSNIYDKFLRHSYTGTKKLPRTKTRYLPFFNGTMKRLVPYRSKFRKDKRITRHSAFKEFDFLLCENNDHAKQT